MVVVVLVIVLVLLPLLWIATTATKTVIGPWLTGVFEKFGWLSFKDNIQTFMTKIHTRKLF
jgi:hypothetical protein